MQNDKWQQPCDRWKLIPEAIIVIHCPPGNWLKRGTFMRKYGFCQFYCGHLSKKRYISGNSDLVYFGWMTWPWHSRWHIGSIQYGTYSRGWKSWEYEFWQSIGFVFTLCPNLVAYTHTSYNSILWRKAIPWNKMLWIYRHKYVAAIDLFQFYGKYFTSVVYLLRPPASILIAHCLTYSIHIGRLNTTSSQHALSTKGKSDKRFKAPMILGMSGLKYLRHRTCTLGCFHKMHISLSLISQKWKRFTFSCISRSW